MPYDSRRDAKGKIKTICSSCKLGRHQGCNGTARQRIRNTGKKDRDWYDVPCQCPCAPRTLA